MTLEVLHRTPWWLRVLWAVGGFFAMAAGMWQSILPLTLLGMGAVTLTFAGLSHRR